MENAEEGKAKEILQMREIIEVPVISDAIRRLGAPTSALVRAGDLLFTCGMPPIDVVTGEIVLRDERFTYCDLLPA